MDETTQSLMRNFAERHALTSDNGERHRLPDEVGEYLRLFHRKAQALAVFRELNTQLSRLKAQVIPHIQRMDGAVLHLNVSNSERHLLGPRGKLRYVERTQVVRSQPDRTVMAERLLDCYTRHHPMVSLDDAQAFVAGSIDYMWMACPERRVTKYVLTRTMPDDKRNADDGGGCGGSALLEDLL